MAGGFYYEKLKHYFDLFGRDRVQVYLNANLQKDILNTIRSMYTFLEVDPAFVPNTGQKHNVSGVPRSQAAASIFNLVRQSPTLQFIKRFAPVSIVQSAKFSLMRKEPLSPEIRARLIEDYRADILNLQGLIGRDLTEWLSCHPLRRVAQPNMKIKSGPNPFA